MVSAIINNVPNILYSRDQDPASLTSSLVLSGLTAQGPPRPLETLPSFEESLAKLNMTSGTAFQVLLDVFIDVFLFLFFIALPHKKYLNHFNTIGPGLEA